MMRDSSVPKRARKAELEGDGRSYAEVQAERADSEVAA
jgi:hypothetical protein